MLASKLKLDFLHAIFSSRLCNNLKMFQTGRVNFLLLSGACIKGEVHSSMAIYFFMLIKSLYKDMLFTKTLASNERLNPTKSFLK